MARRLMYSLIFGIFLLIVFIGMGYFMNKDFRKKWLEDIGVLTEEDYNYSISSPNVVLKIFHVDRYVGKGSNIITYRISRISLNGTPYDISLYKLESEKVLTTTPIYYGTYIKFDLNKVMRDIKEMEKMGFSFYGVVVDVNTSDYSGNLLLTYSTLLEKKLRKNTREIILIPSNYVFSSPNSNRDLVIFCKWNPSIRLIQDCKINNLEIYLRFYNKNKKSVFMLPKLAFGLVGESVKINVSFIVVDGKGLFVVYRNNSILFSTESLEGLKGEVITVRDSILVSNPNDLSLRFYVGRNSYAELENILYNIILPKEVEDKWYSKFISLSKGIYERYVKGNYMGIVIEIEEIKKKGSLTITVCNSNNVCKEKSVVISEAPTLYLVKFNKDEVEELFNPAYKFFIKIKSDGLYYIGRVTLEALNSTYVG